MKLKPFLTGLTMLAGCILAYASFLAIWVGFVMLTKWAWRIG